MEIIHEVTGKDEPGMGKESEAGSEAQGVPGGQISALFIVFGLFLSARWGG
jgi:hypothetical protein